MEDTLDIPHAVKLLEQLNEWVCTFPLTTSFREQTTYRQFGTMLQAKQAELGLTPTMWDELSRLHGNEDLAHAWLEYGMTLDNRELICPTYFLDLPLNAYWMDAYAPVMTAVDDYIEAHRQLPSISDEALVEVVRQHMPASSP
ncbi:hypothetical protein [Pseudoxanthomonas sp.]|jgi:hypothetical protein|uniref:hypothetical protein n=1 Tax=Pseudoxanthomonas sp. TaxID=1871049 RepID=UPI002FE2E1B2